MNKLKTLALTIGHRNLPGASVFKLNLNETGIGHVVGAGLITQATNPPMELHTFVSGHLSVIVSGADANTVISLTGWPVPLPAGLIGENVQCHILLDNGKGERSAAELRYHHNGKWQVLDNLPVSGGWVSLD